MNKNYLELYCNKFNLKSYKNNSTGMCILLETGHPVGIYKEKSKYVFLSGKRYKKSDLICAVLEDIKIH